jgi:hypothetical protein
MQRRVVISAILIAGAGLVALTVRDDANKLAALQAVREISSAADAAAGRFASAIERAYARAPLAVVAFAFGLVLPVAGLVTWQLRLCARLVARSLSRPVHEPPDATPPLRAAVGWLDIGRDSPRRIHLAADLHRIGQDADCDIRIDGAGTGALQAVIRRTPEREYHLIDMSGPSEPAIRLNGASFRVATLRDGDTITAGEMHAIFRHTSNWPLATPTSSRTRPPSGSLG